MRMHRLLLISLCFLVTADLRAHDPGLSSATLWLEEQSLKVELTFSPLDVAALVPLDIDGDGETTEAESRESVAVLEALVRDGFRLWIDGREVTASDFSTKWVGATSDRNVQIELRFPIGGGVSHLGVDCVLLSDLPSGHRQYLSLLDTAGNLLGEALLDNRRTFYEQSLAPSAAHAKPRSFQQFFVLGVEHIVTGYDHLLFLFGVLVVGGSFRSAAKIITSFTVAHSITLVMATMGVVEIPPRIVEPLIAVSIMYIGLENIFRRHLERRWLLTFGFGLVHGLGFASVLRDLGIGSGADAIALPVLAFNLGVEAGQVAVAAVALPVLWKLIQQPSFLPRYCPAGSLMVTMMGVYWLIERTLFN